VSKLESLICTVSLLDDRFSLFITKPARLTDKQTEGWNHTTVSHSAYPCYADTRQEV